MTSSRVPSTRPLRPFVTNGAIVIHTQRLKSDPGGNLLS
ncbi:coproporphyrinogen III oxidase [Escherichia coli]|nr:coproporphyrinogen III oxidase [Escherichia coli]EFN7683417.1 coproporphyrinogen III oxidase [Escherichia coli]EFN7688267.1 coproporphyrinogen III oxidase [Escherichia coli]EFN7754141.1 coproporphyrinogen III oxidase [Escherichia coli]EFN7806998.1 coproporphyrinogen III oxidase [Escherichia coli]